MGVLIGTNGNRNELWHANQVQMLLNLHGVNSQIKVINQSVFEKRDSEKSLDWVLMAFLKKEIDMAVFRGDNLPLNLPEEISFEIAPKRNDSRCVLIGENTEVHLENFTRSFTIAVNSELNKLFLQHYFPNHKVIKDLNVPNPFFVHSKEGKYDAMMISNFEATQVGLQNSITQKLSLKTFTPAAGFGVTAVLTLKTENRVSESWKPILNDNATLISANAELWFKKEIHNINSVPVFAIATVTRNFLELTGGLISFDGSEIIYHTVSGLSSEPFKLGQELAQFILINGGKRIIDGY
jgi:hydroxymethylbilane synthase